MTDDLLARRPLGAIGTPVAPIAIGCAPLGNMPDTFDYEVSEADARATVRAALGSPLNYLDTAAHYGDGESERRIGLVLRELGGLPEGAFLQTKIGADADGNYSGETVRRRFARSLELLGRDHIDLVFLHDPERTTFVDAFATGGPIEVLQGFREQGAIGHLGVAGGPIEMEIRYVESGVFDAVITHNRYTLLNRVAEPLLDLAAARGVALLNAAPYGSGMLAKGPDAYPRYAYRAAPSVAVARSRRLAEICDRHGVPLAAAALQFSMRDPRIAVTVVGMSKPERIRQTLDLAQHPIPDALWDELATVPFDTKEPE
ncbi:MAG: aldo/keto reductase [Chloroflexia bacterium]|nr:aldo/keto reductase [Chloroflexia bacterium]